MVVSESYFGALGIPLVRGRLFDERDREGAEDVVIVNRTLADRYYPNGDAVGRRFRTGGPERPKNGWMRVVGIVGDVKYSGLAEPPDPAFYLPFRQESWSGQFVVVRTAVAACQRDCPGARRRVVDRSRAADRPHQDDGPDAGRSLGRLALPRVPAGCVRGPGTHPRGDRRLRRHGLRGRATHAGAWRPRRAGRPPEGSRALVVRDAGLLAAAGVMLGLIGAWTMTGLTQKLLFQVQPRDPATFAVTAAVLAGAALLAELAARPPRRTDRSHRGPAAVSAWLPGQGRKQGVQRNRVRVGRDSWSFGAGNGIRTRDFDLGKVALYH